MTKSDLIKKLIPNHTKIAEHSTVTTFAPANIALCKYWGKREIDLNLPITNSLSISLANKGASVTIGSGSSQQSVITVNQNALPTSSGPYLALTQFLDYFSLGQTLEVNIDINIPLAAGLASSAAIYAALILALDKRYAWQLSPTSLSILARLGSGSACRSIYSGFVEWHAGLSSDGMDSFAEPLPYCWPELRIGLLIFDNQKKSVSSRDGMIRTVSTSELYAAWPQKVVKDLARLKTALFEKDFSLLGATSESNALAMHATMMSAWPPLVYSTADTLKTMQIIWAHRQEGHELYFTQDAGPNLKLLFLERDALMVKTLFPQIEIIHPFKSMELPS